MEGSRLWEWWCRQVIVTSLILWELLIRIHWVRIRIRIPAFQVDTDPDPGFWWPKTEEKKIQLKFFISFSDQKSYIYLCPSYRRSLALKREHPALLQMKFINFFLCLCVIFALLDPDSDCESGTGYGSRDPIDSGSSPVTDPDPQHWFQPFLIHYPSVLPTPC